MADQGTEGLLSSFLRQRRIKAAIPHLFGRVLDLGCGSGELARHVHPASYLGIEQDGPSIEAAGHSFPAHVFRSHLQASDQNYDTIALLAVIEHVDDPTAFLVELLPRLSKGGDVRVVMTTPHPSYGAIHGWGAALGLFSRSAHAEHKTLLGYETIQKVAHDSGLQIVYYRRFLFGANQLFVLKRRIT